MAKQKSTIPLSAGDFTILPITLPPTPAYNVTAIHHLFLRPHVSKIPSPDDSRSVFLLNVPIDSTNVHFKALITSLIGAGRFESISFNRSLYGEPSSISSSKPLGMTSIPQGKKRKRNGEENTSATDEATQLPLAWDRNLRQSGSSAVLTLVDERSAHDLMKAIKKAHKTVSWPVWGAGIKPSQAPPALGLARYQAQHELSFPPTEEIQESIDAYMVAFNAREAAQVEALRRMRNEPDEDGFVTVTRKGGGVGSGGGSRTGAASMEEAEEARRKEVEKEHRKKEEREKAVGGFYRFQGREKRKEQEKELRRRFDEDRKKVEELKNRRRGLRPEA